VHPGLEHQHDLKSLLANASAQVEEGMGAREEDLAKDMPKLGNPTSRGVLQNGGQVEGYEVSIATLLAAACCTSVPWDLDYRRQVNGKCWLMILTLI